MVTVAGVSAAIALHYANPHIRKLAVELLREKFHADVQLASLEVSIYPVLRVHGSGLSLRQADNPDAPPLFAVRDFSAEAAPLSLFKKPLRISQVQLRGLAITIAPRQGGGKHFDWSKVKDMPVLIDRLTSEDATLEIIPKKANKPHHVYEIHRLVMRQVGLHHPASFTTELMNATPPGLIHAQGDFGPWNADDPGLTPLSAEYTFKNADLGVFRGISGILSSDGWFGGVLNEITVGGETDVPDFTVRVSGHPVHLHTMFSATVDGTNGNTLLHPVEARFLNSVIIANGEVVKQSGAQGRSVLLDVTADDARLEDLMQLAVKADKPIMTGKIKLHTKFDLPPGHQDIMEKLRLEGRFDVSGGQFTSPATTEKIESLSRRGLGKPKDENAGSAVSNLRGNFGLRDSVLSLNQLTFALEGADVKLDGTYGLTSEELDFHGKLFLRAKLSQTMTGFKSFLLKPFDPFFRKNNLTEIPIKVTGTRKQPSFGPDFHHHQSQSQTSAAKQGR